MALFSGRVPAAELAFDIVVNGGSFSAPAAAFAAARENPQAQVLLIEPTDWLGGQATSQGVSAIDNAYHAPANGWMANDEPNHYAADYLQWITRMQTAPPSAPGEGYSGLSGWVSRDCYDPRTGAWALDQLAAGFPNLTVMKLTVLKDLTVEPVADERGAGQRITGLVLIERTPQPGYSPFDDFTSEELPDWYSDADSARFTKATHTVVAARPEVGLVVIDASEVGDALVLSGARYTQGREVSTEAIAEDGSLPALNDDEPMATVYPFAVTTSNVVSDEAEVKTPWPDFDDYLAQRTADYFGLGGFPWHEVWTYRRLLVGPGGSNGIAAVNPGDVSMQNWNPGNDYRQGPWLLPMAATNAQAASGWQGGVDVAQLAIAEKHATAWYFWYKANRSSALPTADTRLLRGSDALNMMDTAHGLAKFPYIRGTRRLVGLDAFRITSRYWRDTRAPGYANGTSFRYYDSVGIGAYSADLRPLIGSSGIAPPFSLPAPFYVPYRALASDNVRNLLACGKLMAQTYVTNSAYRLHPIEWSSGSAAGTAAAIMARDNLDNHDLLPIPALRAYQTRVAANSPIRWLLTGEAVLPPDDGDLVVNGFRPLYATTPFAVEAYHPTAGRAVIRVDGEFLAETTLRNHGRLLHNDAGLNGLPGVRVFTVQLFEDGALVETLTAEVEFGVLPCDQDPTVSDNDDPSVFSLTGDWSASSAQSDRWCPESTPSTYSFKFGNEAPGTATWRLRTTVPGVYQVGVYYSPSTNRATDAPFTVHHRNGSTTVRVNQTTGSRAWIELGTFAFDGTAADRVTLTNAGISNTSRLVIGDAVRAVLIEPDLREFEGWAVY
ncbi:MAG: FAD-dependent oxidoreductase [Sumerlaeia bacterium]